MPEIDNLELAQALRLLITNGNEAYMPETLYNALNNAYKCGQLHERERERGKGPAK